MGNSKFLSSLLLLAVFLATGFFLISRPTENFAPEKIKSVKIAGQIIQVELALSEMERAKGLSGREVLGDNEGMLFIFETPGLYNFWMKNMKFPLDIIWLAPSEGGDTEGMQVVHIKKDARPESYPATYGPDENAKYVLEVNAGFSEKNNLKEGDRAQFTF